MKRFGKFIAVLLMAASLFSMTAFASEQCSLAATEDGVCEIWWMYNNEQHWRACVNHRDDWGNDTVVSEPEAHEFADGLCSVCGVEENVVGTSQTYWIVLIIVVGIGYTIVSRFKPKKLGRDEATTFGLDKFKKIR